MRRAGRGLVILKGGIFNEEIPVLGFGIGHGPIVSDHQCRSRSDGAFKPTGNLTGYAFTKMLPAALGYDVEIEGLNGAGWTMNVINLGQSATLFDRLDFKGGDTLTRKDAALLALNTLKATCVEYTGAGSTNITVNGVPVTISGSQRYSYVTSNQDYARNILPQRRNDVNNVNSYYTVEFAEKHFVDLRLPYDKYDPIDDEFGRPPAEWSYKKLSIGTFPLEADFEHTHEAIIDEATWERVQELRKQRKRPNRYGEVGLFSGLLFCADCGSVMYQQRYETDKRRQDCYICGSYKKRTADCTAHFIRTDLLTAGVTENLRKVTSYAAKHEARFMKLLMAQNEDGGKRKNAARRRELEAAQKRIGELSGIFKRLYEDSVSGRITDERFMELSADYEQEQAVLKTRVTELQAELGQAQEAAVNVEKFMAVVRKYTSFEELTPTLLREFVEKIVVHECWKDEQGTRHQDIEIYYSFVGKVDLPDD